MNKTLQASLDRFYSACQHPTALDCLKAVPGFDENLADTLLAAIGEGAALARADFETYCLGAQHTDDLIAEVCRHFDFSPAMAKMAMQNSIAPLLESVTFDRVDAMLSLKRREGDPADAVKLGAAYYAAFVDHDSPQKNPLLTAKAIGYCVSLQEAAAREIAGEENIGHEHDAAIEGALAASLLVLWAAVIVGGVFLLALEVLPFTILYLTSFFGSLYTYIEIDDSLSSGALHEHQKDKEIARRSRSLVGYVLAQSRQQAESKAAESVSPDAGPVIDRFLAGLEQADGGVCEPVHEAVQEAVHEPVHEPVQEAVEDAEAPVERE